MEGRAGFGELYGRWRREELEGLVLDPETIFAGVREPSPGRPVGALGGERDGDGRPR